jgi:hypothetical protein
LVAAVEMLAMTARAIIFVAIAVTTAIGTTLTLIFFTHSFLQLL